MTTRPRSSDLSDSIASRGVEHHQRGYFCGSNQSQPATDMFTSPQKMSRDGPLTSPQRKASSSPEVCSPLSLYLTMPETFSPEPATAGPTPATEGDDTTDERLARRVNLRVGAAPVKHLGNAKMRLQMSVGSDRRNPTTRSSPGRAGQQLCEMNMALTRRDSSTPGPPDAASVAGRQRELTIDIAGDARSAPEQQQLHGGLLRRLEQLQQAPLPEVASSSPSAAAPGAIPAAARQPPSLLAVEQAVGGTNAPPRGVPRGVPPMSGSGITIVTGQPPAQHAPAPPPTLHSPTSPHASQARAGGFVSPHAPRDS